jgi:germacradienol/geosmin synthase
MSGILEWHRRCERYTEAELRRRTARPDRPPFVPALQPPSLAVSGLAGGSGISTSRT